MPYQLNASTLFLTYPQYPLSQEVPLDALTRLLQGHGIEILEYVVASEEHATGDLHIHCYLKLSAAVRTRDPNFFDIRGHHGNYQGARSAKNVLKSCTKADNFIANIDVAALLYCKSNRQRIAEKIVKEGKDLDQVLLEDPVIIWDYEKLQRNIELWKENSASPKPSLPMWLPNPWGKVLPSFKKSKKRHYWIYSDGPNYGKTTGFAKPLEKEYRCVIQAGDFSSWNVSGSVECIILDDYNTPALKWSTLNQLCDNTYSFRVLYSRPKRLDNFLVIILSNFSIKDLYPNMNIFLYERFNEIKL